MNDESRAADRQVTIDRLALSEIAKALTLAQLVSILSLTLTIIGATFTTGMYVQRMVSPVQKETANDNSTVVGDLRNQLAASTSKIAILEEKEKSAQDLSTKLESKLQESIQQVAQFQGDITTNLGELNEIKAKLAKVEADKKFLLAKAEFLTINSLTFVDAMLSGENLFENFRDPSVAGDPATRLVERKQEYQRIVNKLTGQTEPRVEFTAMDRSGREMSLVFDDDKTHWLMPNFVKRN